MRGKMAGRDVVETRGALCEVRPRLTSHALGLHVQNGMNRVSANVCAVAGMVLFLEEDHFVAEDFIHILRLMERTCRTSCDRCNILSLGTYLKTYNYYGESKKVGGSCRIAVFPLP
jgi:hypothetical protein